MTIGSRSKKWLSMFSAIAMCVGILALAAPPALATHSGSDYLLSSTGYNFEDISGTGIPVPGVTGCDDCTQTIPLGFTFNFYGFSYNDVTVSSNGFLSFVHTGSGCCSGMTLPNTADPDGLVAGYWTDLHPGSGGDVYYQYISDSSGTRLIVQWEQVVLYDTRAHPQTFQIKLFEGTDGIEIHYEAVGPNAGSDHVSAGIENQDGTIGVQHFFDQGDLAGDNQVLSNAAFCYNSGHAGCGGFVGQPRNGRSIDCQPDTATNPAETESHVTCTVLDEAGQPLQYESVTFTTSGPGTIEGTATRETDFQGQVRVTVSSLEAGTQTVTATITDDLEGNEPNDADECDKEAGTPSGSIAGKCSDSVTRTWTVEEPPPPPPGENKSDVADLFIDYVRGSFVGELSSNIDSCEAGRTINLKKVRRGPDRRVGRTTTDAEGAWSIAKPRARGRYYAVSPGTTHPQDDGGTLTCTREVSNREHT